MALRPTITHLRAALTRPASKPYPRSALRRQRLPRRHSSSAPPPGAGPDATVPSTRLARVISRLPASLQPYAARLRGAPVSHVAAFLLLHEVTAVVPLLGLFGLFHYADWVPVGAVTEWCGGYVGEGVGRFERYFKRKGWFGFGQEEGAEGEGEGEVALERWRTDGRYKILVEVALAYAITKVLLPVRILASLWATPWFAGVLVGLQKMTRLKR